MPSTETWTLEEVRQRGFAEALAEVTPLAVIGYPVRHSLSPVMHRAALDLLARIAPEFQRWQYHRIEANAESLPELLERLHRAGFRGLNLTLPHKVEVLPLLTGIAPEAEVMGAVNTLVFGASGYFGTNTDGYGFSRAVKEELGRELGKAPLVLLGAGGAARAIAMQAMIEGCPEIWIGNRSRSRLQELVNLLAPILREGQSLKSFSLREPPTLPSNTLIVNATSLGLKPEDACPLPVDKLSPEHSPGMALFDTTYGRHESQLVKAARAQGIPAVQGLGMLTWQGARSLEIWTGREVDGSVMREAALKALTGAE